MAAWLVKGLAAWMESSPGLVVMLGAGKGEGLEALRAVRADRYVLVEGDPDAASLLHQRAAGLPGVEVRQAVLSADGQELDWHLTEPARFSGPMPAQGLARHYPRLRQLGSRRVASLALRDLLEGLSYEPERPALLVLDLPGQEESLLASCGIEQLRRFDAVLMRGAVEADLWRGSQAIEAGGSFLARRGFKIRLVDRASEPLWPLVELVLDRQKLELEQLRARCDKLVEDLEQARVSASSMQQQAEESRLSGQAIAQQAEQAQVQLEALRRVQAQTEQMAQEHWHTIELLTLERDAALQRRQALEAQREAEARQLREAQAGQQALQAELVATQERESASAAECAALRQQLADALARADNEQQRADEAWRRVGQMGQELALSEGQLELVKDLLLGDPTL